MIDMAYGAHIDVGLVAVEGLGVPALLLGDRGGGASQGGRQGEGLERGPSESSNTRQLSSSLSLLIPYPQEMRGSL